MAEPLSDVERRVLELRGPREDPRRVRILELRGGREGPETIPQPEAAGTPTISGSLARVVGQSAKEIAVGVPTTAAGLTTQAVESGIAFHPPLLAASELHRRATGEKLSESFYGAARAAYDDVVDAQADLINATEDRFGSEVPGAAAATVAFGGVNAINPGKFLKLGSALLGLAPKALALVYGAKVGIPAGIRGLRRLARTVRRIGDVPDAAVPVEGALKAAEESLARIDVNLLAKDARQAAEQLHMFPALPRQVVAGGLPEAAVRAAETEARQRVPQSLRMVEREILRGGDEVFTGVRQEVKEAAREVARRKPDGLTPPPPRRPSLFFDDLREAGVTLAHQHQYNRAQAVLNAARREVATKEMLGGKAGAKLREDLTFLIQGTGDPRRGAADTAQDVLSRVKSHPQGEAGLKLVDDLRERMDTVYRELNDLRIQVGETSLNYLDNYLHQAWKNLGKGQARGRLRIPKDASIEKKRSFLNYRQGMLHAGLEPRTLDIAEIWHLTEREFGRAMAVKKLFRDLVEVGQLDGVVPGLMRVRADKAPEGYRFINAPFLGDLVAGEGRLVINDELYRPLRNILERAGSTEFDQAIDTLTSWAKRLNFSFTMFHAYSLSESAINALGPLGGPRLVGRMVARGGAIPLPGLGDSRRMSNLLKTKTMEEAETLALKHGVTVGPPPTDLMVQTWTRSLETAREKLRIPRGADLTRLYEGAQRQFDLALWERFHHPMKVATHNILYDQFLQLKRGNYKVAGLRPIRALQRRGLQKMSDEEIGRSVAKFVNDEFGGQNWELLQGKVWEFMARPKVLKWLRRIFVSPDWNVSSIRASMAMGAFLQGDPVRGTLGLRHWRNALAGTYFYSNVLNYVLSGRMIWENEPGKDRWHIDTGAKDEKGRKVYLRIGKQYQEIQELALPARGGVPFVNFLARKTFPYLQSVSGAQETPSGFPTAVGEAVDRAEREGRELGFWGYAGAYSKEMLESFAPFALNGTEFGPIIGTVPLPKSRGMSLFAAEARLAEAIRKNDGEMTDRVLEALTENGYNGDDLQRVLSSAQKKAQRFN